ncbi:MAG: cytochrome c peroxidase [Sphingobacteriales bacterium]|jgi:cytochrome c peroxidase
MRALLILVYVALVLTSCKEGETSIPSAKAIEIVTPNGFPSVPVPTNNPMTAEGVKLGKMLFFDPILSKDNSISCGSCHDPKLAFATNNRFEKGVGGKIGDLNSMPLFNIAYANEFFWNGREEVLDHQAFGPIMDPIEMDNSLPNVVSRIKLNEEYVDLFRIVFQDEKINPERVAKVIGQFERTILSGSAKIDSIDFFNKTAFDLFIEGKLSQSEYNGAQIFFSERGDCFHCHGSILGTDYFFHNNGLDSDIEGKGRGAVTENAQDDGKFKTPSVRNLAFTAPYMHDGRFSNLKQVVDFYSSGVKFSETIDPLMKKADKGGIQLSEDEKTDLINFLLIYTDSSFVNNPEFQGS